MHAEIPQTPTTDAATLATCRRFRRRRQRILARDGRQTPRRRWVIDYDCRGAWRLRLWDGTEVHHVAQSLRASWLHPRRQQVQVDIASQSVAIALAVAYAADYRDV